MAIQGSRFCYNVNVNSVPCSSSISFRSLHCFSPLSPRPCYVALDRISGENKNAFFSGQCLSKLPSGRPRKFLGSSVICDIHRIIIRANLLGPGCVRIKAFNLYTKSAYGTIDALSSEGDDIGGKLSAESIILNEQTLQRDLQIAIEEENYAEAAKIGDDLRLLHDNSKASVLAANSRFYDAFRRGDLTTMQNLWAKGDDVCCVHPGANGIVGYDFVKESWEIVWMNYEFPLEIELKNVVVHAKGDFGYVTCMEFVKTKGSSWGGQFVTNAFERINGQCYIRIHHASQADL